MNLTPTNIAVDVMGADQGVLEILEGVKLAIKKFSNLPGITLVGNEDQMKPLLKDLGLEDGNKVTISHASQVIEMDEKPIQSLKTKKDSSMMKALDLLKADEVQAVVSCGNTGSLVVGSTIKLRPMPGIDRPALSTVIPNTHHYSILADAGANPEPDSLNLVYSAILGTHHCRVELGMKKPAVGLLTIGTEEGKGTERIQETHERLKTINHLINYSGLIEGFHVFEGDVDVIICDGFVGNILIKTCESLFHMLKHKFVEELTRSPLRKLGAALSMGAFKSIKHQFNPDRYGAAPLLGLPKTVLKSHGSSNRNTIMNAINTALKIAMLDMNKQIQIDIQEANKLLQPNASNNTTPFDTSV